MLEELDGTANVDVMYVAEMDPPTADGAQVYDIGDDVIEDQLTEVKVGATPTKSHKFKFHKLDPNVETYSVKIRTLVNGCTIVSSTKQVFKSTKANQKAGGGMSIFRKELKIQNTFESVLDNSTDESSIEEETKEEKEEKKRGEGGFPARQDPGGAEGDRKK